jgi:hypothetical protein
MTFSVSRKDPERRPEVLTVQCTYGPITINVDEHHSHLRSFWTQLGAELDKAEGRTS